MWLWPSSWTLSRRHYHRWVIGRGLVRVGDSSVGVAVGIGVSVGVAVGGGIVSSRLALSTKTAPSTLATSTCTNAVPGGAMRVLLCTENPPERPPAVTDSRRAIGIRHLRSRSNTTRALYQVSPAAEKEKTYVALATADETWRRSIGSPGAPNCPKRLGRMPSLPGRSWSNPVGAERPTIRSHR